MQSKPQNKELLELEEAIKHEYALAETEIKNEGNDCLLEVTIGSSVYKFKLVFCSAGVFHVVISIFEDGNYGHVDTISVPKIEEIAGAIVKKLKEIKEKEVA